MSKIRYRNNNVGFSCQFCGSEVKPLERGNRDHCPKCLCSLHVDIAPGDRANPCKGKLQPLDIIMRNGKTQIRYNCEKCRQVVYCETAKDDNINQILVGNAAHT